MIKDEALTMALVAMETIIPDAVCSVVHHPRKDQHEKEEPCPISQRFAVAITAVKEALAQQNHSEQVLDMVAAEREACAKVCEEYETNNDITATWLNIVAEAIRARGQA